jgi:hypothetical protein
MFSRIQRENYNIDRQRICEKLGITKNEYNSFRRYGQTLRKLYEDQCNGFLDINNGLRQTKMR